jgi:O-methyltransferase
VQGFYNESLKTNLPNKLGIKKASLVYVDCDLYESTVPVLNYILPVLQTGTIIAFDDYYCFNGDPERGGQLALREFLQRNPNLKMTDYLNIGWGGKSFIVKIY